MPTHKWYLLITFAVVTICFGLGLLHGASHSSANYALERDAITGGGEAASSANYSLSHALCESSPPGASSSSGYNLYAGFRHPTKVSRLPDSDGGAGGSSGGCFIVACQEVSDFSLKQ